MDLFPLADFASYVQQDVDTATATTVRRVASGWLRSVTGLRDWPDPVPDDLYGWGLELAAIAYGNPEALANQSVGAVAIGFGGARRAEILEEARRAYRSAVASVAILPWTSPAVPV